MVRVLFGFWHDWVFCKRGVWVYQEKGWHGHQHKRWNSARQTDEGEERYKSTNDLPTT